MVTSTLINQVQRLLDDAQGQIYPASVIATAFQLVSSRITGHRTFERHLFRNTGTFTLTSGTATYDLATQFTDYNLSVFEVIYDPTSATSRQAQKIMYVNPDKIFDWQYLDTAQVDYYTIVGTNLIFAGVPASTDSGVTIQVRYGSNDGTYTAGGAEETTLGKYFPHLLVYGAAHRLAMAQQDNEVAATADRLGKAYEDGFNEAIQKLSSDTDEPRGVEVTEPGLI